MGISFSAMISMITVQQREGRAIQQQLARGSLKYAILQTMRNLDNCACQFNSPGDLKSIDTTQTASGGRGDEISLGVFRSGCGGGSDNILALQGERVKNGAGLEVESVKVSQIVETGTPNEYVGDLIVVYKSDIRVIKPLSVPLLFTVDPNAGSSSRRPILFCGANNDYTERMTQLLQEMRNHANNIKASMDGLLQEVSLHTNDMKVRMDEMLAEFANMGYTEYSHQGQGSRLITGKRLCFFAGIYTYKENHSCFVWRIGPDSWRLGCRGGCFPDNDARTCRAMCFD